MMRIVFNKAKQDPKRIVLSEGEHEKIIRAAHQLVEEGLARPILLGNAEQISAIASCRAAATRRQSPSSTRTAPERAALRRAALRAAPPQRRDADARPGSWRPTRTTSRSLMVEHGRRRRHGLRPELPLSRRACARRCRSSAPPPACARPRASTWSRRATACSSSRTRRSTSTRTPRRWPKSRS